MFIEPPGVGWERRLSAIGRERTEAVRWQSAFFQLVSRDED
jgi:hypothetical protein